MAILTIEGAPLGPSGNGAMGMRLHRAHSIVGAHLNKPMEKASLSPQPTVEKPTMQNNNAQIVVHDVRLPRSYDPHSAALVRLSFARARKDAGMMDASTRQQMAYWIAAWSLGIDRTKKTAETMLAILSRANAQSASNAEHSVLMAIRAAQGERIDDEDESTSRWLENYLFIEHAQQEEIKRRAKSLACECLDAGITVEIEEPEDLIWVTYTRGDEQGTISFPPSAITLVLFEENRNQAGV